jgi:adenylosuccinate synthase
MTCTAVVGLQWGDEAKGKLVDLLAPQHDLVVRYNGGANAGHTIVRQGQKFKLSIIPSGILQPGLTCVIGNGLVVNPVRLLEEVDSLRSAGIEVGANLRLSERAHVIFPYHQAEEQLIEASQSQAGAAIGTTGRGIGPCYQDKAGRLFAVRVVDLLDAEVLHQRLSRIVPHKNRLLQALAQGQSEPPPQFEVAALHAEYLRYAQRLRPFVCDTGELLRQAVRAGKRLLFEAAQGSLLDVDHGTYPYVTSSNSTPAGIWTGAGVSARHLSRVIGVIKAYSTRVGQGPMPTELLDGPDGLGERIRRAGNEFGTVTGRPRRVGWLDLVALRYTAELAGVDELALMLLDVLSVVPELRICTEYRIDGERVRSLPAELHRLERAEPVYQTLPGWQSDISHVRRLGDLPAAARAYVDCIAESLQLPVRLLSVGPDREQTIFCD